MERGMPAGERLWLTTREAAERLELKPATLYAYVSRGLLEARRTENGRGSLFHREDVERLAARGQARRRPPSLDFEVRSAITDLTPTSLRYRGRPIDDLATRYTFEQVAELLWTGELADTTPWPAPASARAARDVQQTLPEDTPSLERLRIACAIASTSDPLRALRDQSAMMATGRSLIATLVEALPPRPGSIQPPPDAPIAARLLAKFAEGPLVPERVRLLDAALIVCADHELAVSTVAARVAASAHCDPYAVVECGLATTGGPLHGGVTRYVERLLDGLAPEDAEQRVAAHLREYGEVPGFGHRIYDGADPRATTMLALMRELLEPRQMATVDAVLAIARARHVGEPNADLALGALTTALGLPPGSAVAIFGLARCAGWLAHAFEQYQTGDLIRPRAIYVGAR
jgi:citrate synthase